MDGVGADGGSEAGRQAPNPRLIKTIDGRPAAEVYNEWTQGAIAEELAAAAADVALFRDAAFQVVGAAAAGCRGHIGGAKGRLERRLAGASNRRPGPRIGRRFRELPVATRAG